MGWGCSQVGRGGYWWSAAAISWSCGHLATTDPGGHPNPSHTASRPTTKKRNIPVLPGSGGRRRWRGSWSPGGMKPHWTLFSRRNGVPQPAGWRREHPPHTHPYSSLASISGNTCTLPPPSLARPYDGHGLATSSPAHTFHPRWAQLSAVP